MSPRIEPVARPVRIPTGEEIREIRRQLDLTNTGFAELIGFSDHNGADHVRFLETGAKGGKPYVMTGPAANSLWRALAIRMALQLLAMPGHESEAAALLRTSIPEGLW